MARSVAYVNARDGRARVRVRGHGVYEGSAVYDGRAVHLLGCRLRVVTGPSYDTTVTFRAPRSWTIPISRCEIEWLDEAP